jgi:hypothetical protein
MNHRPQWLFALPLVGYVFPAPVSPAAQTAPSPSPGIDELLNLKRVGAAAISPDGRSVAYTVRETNREEN